MSLQLKVFCYHKDEPEDDETGFCPSHEMILDTLTHLYGEANFVCPECGHEVYIKFAKQTSGVTQAEVKR